MKLGGNDIVNVQLGSTQVNKVYQGANLVWEYEPPVFEFSVKTDNAGVSTSTEFRMPLITSTGLDMNVDWGDGSPIENITDHTLAIHDYGTAGTYTIKVTGSILGWQFNYGGDKLKMLDVKQWSGLNISVDSGFYGCTNLTATATDAPLITSTSLSLYFTNCSVFNGAIGNWDVSNITDMQDMFSGATFFNQNIGAWDVSKVINFRSMFRGSTSFDNDGSDDINNWQLSNISSISMYTMFSSSNPSLPSTFNRNISSWDTSKVIIMRGMFQNNVAFNQNIGAWDVSSVTNMQQMFEGATAFNQDISNWDINQVIVFTNFMLSATLSTTNYDLLLVGWEAQAPLTGKSINFGGSKYTLGSAAATARASLISTYGWTITDGGGI